MRLRRCAPEDNLQEIRIKATDALADWCVLPALAEFRRRHPDVLCRLETPAAHSAPVDICVQEFNTEQRDDVLAERLVVDNWRLFASESYAAGRGMPQSVRELNDHSFVLGLENLSHHQALESFDRSVSGNDVALRCSSMAGIRRAIREGLGLGLLPDYMGWADPDLVPSHIDVCDNEGGVWLLVHAERANDPVIASVVDCVRAQI